MTKKAIGLLEYNQLTESEQLDILHRDGVYVGKRKLQKQTAVLFQLYGFYVEVVYKIYRRQIHHMMASDNTDILQPYIEQVQVKGLNKNPGIE